ncbi:hypothetical protein [Streptomyces sp. NPDC050164]|uniref:hypothetical protein n=1 Tax=Streptomyces sp. NPDC050164 TaxID=3365605 RepID=UPI0037B200A6
MTRAYERRGDVAGREGRVGVVCDGWGYVCAGVVGWAVRLRAGAVGGAVHLRGLRWGWAVRLRAGAVGVRAFAYAAVVGRGRAGGCPSSERRDRLANQLTVRRRANRCGPPVRPNYGQSCH